MNLPTPTISELRQRTLVELRRINERKEHNYFIKKKESSCFPGEQVYAVSKRCGENVTKYPYYEFKHEEQAREQIKDILTPVLREERGD